MAMGEEMWLRDGWEIPASDDEMEYDLSKCIDSKLTACFDALTKQKTLTVSPALYGRPILASLHNEFEPSKEQSLVNEPPSKQLLDDNDNSIFDAFDYHEDKSTENVRKRAYPTGGGGRHLGNKKATLGNVMNNMMRHKRLENNNNNNSNNNNIGNQLTKGGMYSSPGDVPQYGVPPRQPARGSSVAQEITQNVMAQSRSINESMASLNMPRSTKNMPMTTPQPAPLGQSPQQGIDIPRSPNLSSPNPMFPNNVSQMSHVGQNMGPPPNQTMMAANMMMRGPRPDQRTMHYPMQHMGDLQQQQQMYQRMTGMYKSPNGLTLVQGSNMGPRMVYNPISGQTIMTTQHSGLMGPQSTGPVMGNNVLVSRTGMIGPGGGMIPGMGPAPPNMSASMVQAANMNPQHKMMQQQQQGPDNCQIVVSQAMHPGNLLSNPSIVPNQTISNHGPMLPRTMLSPDNKKLLNKMGGGGMMPPHPMSPNTLVSPPVPQHTSPPSGGSPGSGDNSRDNITLNTAVADPQEESMSAS